MAFVRNISPVVVLSGDALTEALVSIGMRFATRRKRIPEANIEDALYFASWEGLEKDDLRLLSVLTVWIEKHIAYVNADRLTQLVKQSDSNRVKAYWAAVAAWHEQDSRLRHLRELSSERRVHLLKTGSAFQLSRRGEDPRFSGTRLAVPDGTLRRRLSDVLDPDDLARKHRGYYYRVLTGPTYRADMWAALDADRGLTTAQVARAAYGSYATANRVKRDHAVLMRRREAKSA